MTEDSTTPELTRQDLVFLLDVDRDLEYEYENNERIAAYVRSDPRLAERIRELDQLAEDAGVESLDVAVQHLQELEALLAAETGWVHPVEVLDVIEPEIIDIEPILGIAEARLDRGDAEKKKLREVVGKLRRVQDHADRVRALLGELGKLSQGAQQHLLWPVARRLNEFQEEAQVPA